MNPLAQIAVDLKQKGYPQDLRVGDMTFSEQGSQYIEFRGDMNILGPNWVKVPSLVNIQNQLCDCAYSLTHTPPVDNSGSIDDDTTEMWKLNDKNVIFEDPNVWVVMAKYWMFVKGK